MALHLHECKHCSAKISVKCHFHVNLAKKILLNNTYTYTAYFRTINYLQFSSREMLEQNFFEHKVHFSLILRVGLVTCQVNFILIQISHIENCYCYLIDLIRLKWGQYGCHSSEPTVITKFLMQALLQYLKFSCMHYFSI